MALESDLETRICLVWTTEKPFANAPRKSNIFSVFGSECQLELMSNNGYYYVIFNRACDTTPLIKVIEITTYLNFGLNSACSSLINTKYVRATNDVVWEFKEEVVLRNLPKSKDAAWKFFCLFHVSPATVAVKNETIHLSIQPTTSDKCVQDSANIPPDMKHLSGDFSNLLPTKNFPDAHVNCQTRSVLAARSEASAAMFRNEMTERDYCSVDVNDLNVPPVLDMLLTYVRSGKISDICDDTAADLYEAAAKYAMSTLKMACCDWMVCNVTKENCISFLGVADTHNDVKLKNAVVAFMNDHPDIFTSEKWSRFSEDHPNLALEVLQNYIITSRK